MTGLQGTFSAPSALQGYPHQQVGQRPMEGAVGRPGTHLGTRGCDTALGSGRSESSRQEGSVTERLRHSRWSCAGRVPEPGLATGPPPSRRCAHHCPLACVRQGRSPAGAQPPVPSPSSAPGASPCPLATAWSCSSTTSAWTPMTSVPVTTWRCSRPASREPSASWAGAADAGAGGQLCAPQADRRAPRWRASPSPQSRLVLSHLGGFAPRLTFLGRPVPVPPPHQSSLLQMHFHAPPPTLTGLSPSRGSSSSRWGNTPPTEHTCPPHRSLSPVPPTPCGIAKSAQLGLCAGSGRPASQGARTQGCSLLLAGSVAQSRPLAWCPHTTSWPCSSGRVPAPVAGASRPPTRPSMPQRVGAVGEWVWAGEWERAPAPGQGTARAAGGQACPWAPPSPCP